MPKLTILLFFLSGCTSVFFQPTKKEYTVPENFDVEYDSLYFKSLDNTQLHAWHLKNFQKLKRPKSLVLYFHGNGQNLSAHFLNLAWLTRKGHDVLIFDYRGYGKSAGVPIQEGVHYDALAAMDYGYHLGKKIGAKKFIVYGQSLGGAISLKALAEFKHKDKVDLLVQDSTFSSYQDLAFEKLNDSWVTWLISPIAYLLISDKYATNDVWKDVPKKIPLLVIHGSNDEVVPLHHGEKIYQASNNPKYFWKIKNGTHTDIFIYHNHRYRKQFIDFIEQKIPGRVTPTKISKIEST